VAYAGLENKHWVIPPTAKRHGGTTLKLKPVRAVRTRVLKQTNSGFYWSFSCERYPCFLIFTGGAMMILIERDEKDDL